MKTLLYIFCCLTSSIYLPKQGLAQKPVNLNDFVIGMFGFDYMYDSNGLPTNSLKVGGFNSSQLNVLAEDGFNLVTRYNPDYWTSQTSMQRLIDLTSLNSIKILTNTKDWYKANASNLAVSPEGTIHATLQGTNIYNSSTGSHPNFDSFFDNLYSLSGNKNKVWGHQICEESALFNHHNYTNNSPDVSNGWPPNNFIETEIPLNNVLNAIAHFKTKRDGNNLTKQKLVVMEANHSAGITSNLVYDHENNNPFQYTAKHLLDQLDSDIVFLEGSYMRFPSNWIYQNYQDIFGSGPNTYHYLGFAKSIDFAKAKCTTVHDVLSSIINTNEYWNHFHSNSNLKNANYLWFQAYTSIIHGATGIWFWDLPSSWEDGEKPVSWDTNPQRFERGNFSNLYKNFVSNLAREVRFLVNKNVLSTNPNTILATKTEFVDTNCILPPASTYIPSFLPNEKKSEVYGLRYTIRTNGTETYMIITNPLNCPINVNMNFSNSFIPQIQNSTGVTVLFDNNQYLITSGNYKLDRYSAINLTDGTVGKKYIVSYLNNKQLPLSFGPLDVKVIKFNSLPTNNAGWESVWTNHGNGKIGGHDINDSDLFYSADIDGDSAEELICVTNNINSSNDWITILKYNGENWQWFWSNYGSSTVSEIYQYRDNFVFADFDGDGIDELLGNIVNGTTSVFKFINGSWVIVWTDSNNPNHPIKPYKDKFYVGDFNGNGKSEILGCDLPNGWTTSFEWNGSDFTWGWSDYGANHAIRPYRSAMQSGDFNGNGKSDLLGFDGWSTLFSFENNDWQWSWSTLGDNNFNGWEYPPLESDRILVGDIDIDNKDELFFIQTQSNASWAATMDWDDYQDNWNWNWSANPVYSTPFINNWPIASSSNNTAKYFLIKAKSTDSKYLLAMRKHCNNYLVSMYKTNALNNYKFSITENNYNLSNKNVINLYPNPTSDILHVTSSKTKIFRIEIIELDGQIIRNDENREGISIIDLTELKRGVYIVKCIDENNEANIQKIILN